MNQPKLCLSVFGGRKVPPLDSSPRHKYNYLALRLDEVTIVVPGAAQGLHGLKRSRWKKGAVLIVGLLLGTIPAAAQSVTYTYDAAGRLTGFAWSTPSPASSGAIAYAYDAAGNLVLRETTRDPNLLFFPFYQAGSSTFLGIAVSNYSGAGAELTFTALGPAGQVLGFDRNPAVIPLPSGRQYARLASEIFKTGSNAQNAWIQLAANTADLGSFFQFGNGSLTQLDGSTAVELLTREFHFTRVYESADGYRGQPVRTYLSIANPSDEEAVVDLSLHEPGGVTVATNRLTIPGRGFTYRSIGQIFGLNRITGGYVKARQVTGRGLAAFELVELTSRVTVIGLGANSGNLATELYSAQLADGSFIYTSLKLVNVSDQPRRARLAAVGDNGTPLTDTKTILLAPGASLEQDAGPLFGLPTQTRLTIGSVRIETDGPGVIGDVVFGDPTGFRYAAAMPLQNRRFTRAIFSQVANTQDFFTGLALYNPNPAAAQVTVRVFDVSGQNKGERTIPLGPGTRSSGLVPDLVPGTAGVVGGYIVVESSLPVIGQQIFGESRLYQYSAVPPKIVE